MSIVALMPACSCNQCLQEGNHSGLHGVIGFADMQILSHAFGSSYRLQVHLPDSGFYGAKGLRKDARRQPCLS